VGKAHIRNRAKRLLKAHFITFADELIAGQYIFVAKTPLLNSNFSKVNRNFLYIYKKLKLIKRGNGVKE